jgi:kynureninase
MNYINSIAFAKELDEKDPLKHFRSEFHIPNFNPNGCYYFTGNSLGLMPKRAKAAIEQELDDWAKYGVEGHFEAKNPWFSYHENFKKGSALIVGAKESEVTVMNGLTTNLHLMMASFYQPKGKRYKILCEAKAFPSDQYALESQVKFHGFDPEDAIIEIPPRLGEHTINQEDIYDALKIHGDQIALVMIGGVNYYTGQVFDMKTITEKGHRAGAIVGFDLAHGAGNIELKLHEWGVDFAAWCSYKYLNSGPGSVSGVFVHQRHEQNNELKRFAGWWGTPAEGRFKMAKGFEPATGADGWQLSNAPVLAMAAHKASLDLFEEAGMENIFAKRDALTGYLEFIINDISARNPAANFEIITPKTVNERGSQISILTHGTGKDLFDYITEKGVIADWREPNVIRMAPVPLYNSFEDVYQFGQLLEAGLKN